MTSGYDAQTAARLATAGEEAAAAFARRSEPTAGLAAQADAVAQACHAMAVRFHQGGKLVVFGTGAASTDAPTVTGIAEREGMDAIFSHQLRYLTAPGDIALGICATGNCGSVLAGLATARELGLLTIALTGRKGRALTGTPAADHVLVADSDDPRVVKEMHVTMYHLLWELVHVFLEQPGTLSPGVLT